jgi:hypothetical protein
MANSDDKGLMVRFFTHRAPNEAKSLIEGRDIWDEVECISIRVPGSRDHLVNAVNDEYRVRFADEYRAYKRDQVAPLTGTPLEEWPAASTSFVDEMRLYGIRSVEQLAGLSDGAAMVNPGWMTMRTRAQAFLDSAKDNAKTESLAVENETLKQQMAAMQAQMQRLMQMIPAPAETPDAATVEATDTADPAPKKK